MAKKYFGFGDRYCTSCGAYIEKHTDICPACHKPYDTAVKYADIPAFGGGIGWSTDDTHPSFAKYKSRTRKGAFWFLIVFSIAIGAFLFLSGQLEKSAAGLRNYAIILAIIWGLDILILLFQNAKRSSFEATLENKKSYVKRTTRRDSDGNTQTEHHTVYKLRFRKQNGKVYTCKKTDDGTLYGYLEAGDVVRFIGKLRYFEKYDKSHDGQLLCAGCGMLRDVRDDFCGRCGCKMLKAAKAGAAQGVPQPDNVQAAKPVQTGSTCPQCGHACEAAARFCPDCGAPLTR